MTILSIFSHDGEKMMCVYLFFVLSVKEPVRGGVS